MKMDHPFNLGEKELMRAYNFLEKLDNKVYTNYSSSNDMKGSILLTSDSFSNAKIKERFMKLIGDPTNKSVAIITTAAKDKEKNKYAQLTYSQMKEIGFSEIDFVDFEKGEGKDLSKYNVFYVCGGNTFSLLKFAKEMGFDKSVKKLLERGGVYVGVSAGSLIMGPSVQIANEIKPDINTVGLSDFSGMRLIDHIVFPHYKAGDETALLDFETRNDVKTFRLSNGEALLIRDNSEEVIN